MVGFLLFSLHVCVLGFSLNFIMTGASNNSQKAFLVSVCSFTQGLLFLWSIGGHTAFIPKGKARSAGCYDMRRFGA